MRRIEALTRQHDRAGFDCGNAELNRYLQQTARQHANKGIARSFVIVDEAAPSRILAYATLALCEIQTTALPEKLAKKYPPTIPGAKLARLAVDIGHQRQGLGAELLVDMLRRIVQVADSVGIVALFVDAKNADAVNYYQQYGFLPLANNDLQLYLPLDTLRQFFD